MQKMAPPPHAGRISTRFPIAVKPQALASLCDNLSASTEEGREPWIEPAPVSMTKRLVSFSRL